MNITALKGEFLGRNVRVASSKDPSLVGLEGEVIAESKNMLRVRTEDGDKSLIKANSVFQMDMDGELYEIPGKCITFRPEDRIKKVKRWEGQ